MTTPHLAGSFETLLAHPAHAQRIISAQLDMHDPVRADRFRGEDTGDVWNGYRVESGAALVPIMGSLLSRGKFRGMAYGMTSYEGVRAELRRALDDPKVSRIVLMIDSPGGYVAGVDATAAAIRAAAAKKPVIAVVEGLAASAAYWLASQADEIIASPVSELGSIGVVQAHIDLSEIYKEAGVKVTLLHAGAKKVDGNPYEPLPDRVKAEMTQRLEDLRLAFAGAIAQGRKSLDVAAVLATEAATYLAEEAVARGLADRVGTLDDALSLPFSAARSGRTFMEQNSMTTATAAPGAEGTISKDAHEAALATARAEGNTAGLKAGAEAERTRIAAIMDHEAAQGRESFARHIAFKTDMAAEAAHGMLAAAPAAAAPAPAAAPEAGLLNEMRGATQAKLGAGAAESGGEHAEMSDVQRGAAEARRLLGKS